MRTKVLHNCALMFIIELFKQNFTFYLSFLLIQTEFCNVLKRNNQILALHYNYLTFCQNLTLKSNCI